MQLNKKKIDIDFVKKWQAKGIDPIVLSILSRRNFTDDNGLLDFFVSSLDGNINPFDFTQITYAYDRIDRAIANNEKIIINGDKDVDGTSSVAIITDWLEQLIIDNHSNAKLDWEVPTGKNQYGLSAEKINTWAGKYNFCITVDCGITNVNEVNLLNTYNIDTIILDHHENLEVLPKCLAIVNPMCEQSITQKKIAACVVVFLFIIGYYFYRSKFYNKKVGVFYTKDNVLIYDIYVNLKKVNSIEYEKLSIAQPQYADANYFLADKICFSNEISAFFKNNHIIPIEISKFINQTLYSFTKDKTYISQIILPKILYSQIEKIGYVKQRYLCLATLGTVADVMPLKGINRAIVNEGLALMRAGTLKNISDLVNRAKLNLETITSKDLAWTICPLLNASGRMGDATITVYFLKDRNNSGFYLDAIFNNNKQRKDYEEFASNMFKKQYDADPQTYKQVALFYSDKIHKGVTGIVAAQLAKYTGVPAIIIARDDDLYVGSMRGDSKISCVDFLSKFAPLLSNFGGHHAAAGFSLSVNNIIEFAQSVFDNASCLEKDTVEVRDIDAQIPIQYLNYDLIKKLSILEPFGQENESPLLYTENIEVERFSSMGNNGAHLKLNFKTMNEPLAGVYWSKSKWFKQIHNPNNKYNILYQLETNYYNGVLSPQLMIVEMEISQNQL